MKLEGVYAFDAPLDTVWRGLFNPEVLAKTLPGCDKLERRGDQFTGEINVKMGPVQGKFQGKVEIQDVKEHESYTMVVDSRGPAGFAKATARIRVRHEGQGTRLEYDSEVQVGGRIASIGQRLLDASSRAIVKQSLEGLNQQLKALADRGAAAETVGTELERPEAALTDASSPELAAAGMPSETAPGSEPPGSEPPGSARPAAAQASREPALSSSPEAASAPSERPPSGPSDWLTPAPRSERAPGSRPRSIPLPEGVERRSPRPAAVSVPSPAGVSLAGAAHARVPGPSAPSQSAFAYGVFKEVAKDLFPAKRVALAIALLLLAGLVYRVLSSR